jgi:4a-hydroxytetrahydrobiopterin dehydratase
MADTQLASHHCEACEQGTPPMEEQQAALLTAELHPGWKREATTTLRRRLHFEDFKDAFGFATRIALVAEEEGHHPDLEIGWGKVAVALTTHSSGGLTRNDFIMAAKIDRLATGTGLKET